VIWKEIAAFALEYSGRLCSKSAIDLIFDPLLCLQPFLINPAAFRGLQVILI
jgi:hypothetical protein